MNKIFRYYNFNIENESKHGSLKLFNMSVFSFYKIDGLLWFRIFGYGLHFKDITKHKLMFSERISKRKRLMIGFYLIKILK
jgi:hypothetical protein